MGQYPLRTLKAASAYFAGAFRTATASRLAVALGAASAIAASAMVMVCETSARLVA